MPPYTAQRTDYRDVPHAVDFNRAAYPSDRVRPGNKAQAQAASQAQAQAGAAQTQTAMAQTRIQAFAGSATAARRGELKYLLDEETYQRFRSAIRPYVEPDAFAVAQICSLYLDSHEHSLIRRSLEKPRYKEKLRIRAYQADPGLNSACFLEIKKKNRGTVYKRRVEMTLREAILFCRNRAYPEGSLTALPAAERAVAEQVLQEIGWMYSMYGGLQPSFSVSCKRLSLKERTTDSLRITFDRDVAWSQANGSYAPTLGEHALLEEGMRLMEIKARAAMPLWLVRIMGELKIYPQGFSKAGSSYRSWLANGEGGLHGR